MFKQQVDALIKVAHLPNELEGIIKDLWLMHVSMLEVPDEIDDAISDDVEPEALNERNTARHRSPDTSTKVAHRDSPDEEATFEVDIQQGHRQASYSKRRRRDSTDDDDVGRLPPSFRMEIDDESSQVENSSEVEDATPISQGVTDDEAPRGDEHVTEVKSKRRLNTTMSALKIQPHHRLTLLYLGCFVLQLPIFPSDILK